MDKLFLILVSVFILASCSNSDEKKNREQMKLAQIAIEKAGLETQLVMELPFGLKFGMKPNEVKSYIEQLKERGIASNINRYAFDYRYPEYSGLTSSVEVFFYNDELCRLVFSFPNTIDYISDWGNEYQNILKIPYEQSFKYYVPYEGLKEEDSDKFLIEINKNMIIIEREIFYSTLSPEKIFIIDNQPLSKHLPNFLTKNETLFGNDRQKQIVEKNESLNKYGVENKINKEKNLEQNKNAEVRNSTLDASVYQVKIFLKRTLKDPGSYESIEWSSVQQVGDKFIVRHKYRAKNSFGGFVVENQIFTINTNGDIVNVVDFK